MNDFYLAFEEKYRGSRATIIERLSAYGVFLDAVVSDVNEPVAIDLGCGRGEWLELLSNRGVNAKGVDHDENMVVICQQRGFDVRHGDIFEFLKKIEDHSVDILSAFHVIEHISFELLQELMVQATRVLKPGGLIIFETPNPENISVATNSFYLDPTHIKPLPPGLLKFIAEYYQCDWSLILRLDNYSAFKDERPVTLSDVIKLSSPDYALVAVTRAEDKSPRKIHDLFINNDDSFSFDTQLYRWDVQYAHLQEAIKNLQEATKSNKQRIEFIENTVLYRAEQYIKRHYVQAGLELQRLKKIRLVFLLSTFKGLIKKLLWKFKHKLQCYPKLQKNIIRFLEKFPYISVRVRRLMYSTTSENSNTGFDCADELSLSSSRILNQIQQRKALIKKDK